MHFPGMQSAEDAVNAADTQNLIASIAGILQGTTAALPTGPPPLGGPTPAGAGGSPGRAAADAANAAAAAAAAASAMPGGLMMLPHQLGGGIPGFPGINLNDPSLAPYLQLASLGAPGLAMDPNLQQLMGFAMPGQPGGMQINLASLLASTGVELDPSAAADLAGGLMGGAGGKPGQMSGVKRPADNMAGGAYKRERSEEAGRGREQGKCHVEGCTVDLTTAGPYYQRYRTCEAHLKAPFIIKDGMQQRFCQQCGRFHELSEFDNNKRSCRARLQSHNQRRRKRTEEQMANQGGDGGGGGGHGGGAAAGMMQGGGGLMQPGAAAGLGAQMAALGAHGLLGGGAPNLTDILNSMGGMSPEQLLASMDPSKMPQVKPDELAALLSSMSPALLGSLGMAPPDANAALLALAAAGGAGADALTQPLLDSILKSAAGAVPPAPMAPADLSSADLQQQLAMALAASGGGMPDQASMEAALAAAAVMDPHTLAAAAAAAGMSHHQLVGHHHHHHHHHDPMGGAGHHMGGHHGDGTM